MRVGLMVHPAAGPPCRRPHSRHAPLSSQRRKGLYHGGLNRPLSGGPHYQSQLTASFPRSLALVNFNNPCRLPCHPRLLRTASIATPTSDLGWSQICHRKSPSRGPKNGGVRLCFPSRRTLLRASCLLWVRSRTNLMRCTRQSCV